MRAVMAITRSWQDELAARTTAPLRRDEPLARFTTFRIGGPADVLAEPRSDDEVAQVVSACASLGVPLTILGGGSNVLIGDRGIRGCVLRMGGKLSALVVSDGGKRVSVGAGASFARLTKVCMGLGWPRSNGWVGTPGTVGGALIMNAGSRQGELGEVVESVRALVDGAVVELPLAACGFAYRHSAFPAGAVLLGAELRCDAADATQAAAIEQAGTDSLVRRKSSQPREHSAGSIFKNPPGDFAGRLIEAAGLKGTQHGGARISEVHANFIVNTGGATAEDVCVLAARAQALVQEKFNVALQWEVRRIGEFA